MKRVYQALASLGLLFALSAGVYAETKSCCADKSCCNGQSCCRKSNPKK